jgi:hypothetical protein
MAILRPQVYRTQAIPAFEAVKTDAVHDGCAPHLVRKHDAPHGCATLALSGSADSPRCFPLLDLAAAPAIV